MKEYFEILFRGMNKISTLFLTCLLISVLALAIGGEPGDAIWGAFWFFLVITLIYLGFLYVQKR
jgi:ABC-type multidrug transport system permease subunit